jgi:hypothetical protein
MGKLPLLIAPHSVGEEFLRVVRVGKIAVGAGTSAPSRQGDFCPRYARSDIITSSLRQRRNQGMDGRTSPAMTTDRSFPMTGIRCAKRK